MPPDRQSTHEQGTRYLPSAWLQAGVFLGSQRLRQRFPFPLPGRTWDHAVVSEIPTSLFLYGTLMPGQMRWPELEPYALWAEPATAQGRLWDTGRGYPAARFHDEAHSIPGVLVGIAPALLAYVITALDHIEAEGVLYRRVHVLTSGGPAISYEWLGVTEGLRSLPDGWS